MFRLFSSYLVWHFKENLLTIKIRSISKKRPFEEWLTLADLPSEDEEPPDKKANEGDVKFHPQNPNAWMNNGQMNNRFRNKCLKSDLADSILTVRVNLFFSGN